MLHACWLRPACLWLCAPTTGLSPCGVPCRASPSYWLQATDVDGTANVPLEDEEQEGEIYSMYRWADPVSKADLLCCDRSQCRTDLS